MSTRQSWNPKNHFKICGLLPTTSKPPETCPVCNRSILSDHREEDGTIVFDGYEYDAGSIVYTCGASYTLAEGGTFIPGGPCVNITPEDAAAILLDRYHPLEWPDPPFSFLKKHAVKRIPRVASKGHGMGALLYDMFGAYPPTICPLCGSEQIPGSQGAVFQCGFRLLSGKSVSVPGSKKNKTTGWKGYGFCELPNLEIIMDALLSSISARDNPNPTKPEPK